jgi:hypothetical protein
MKPLGLLKYTLNNEGKKRKTSLFWWVGINGRGEGIR